MAAVAVHQLRSTASGGGIGVETSSRGHAYKYEVLHTQFSIKITGPFQLNSDNLGLHASELAPLALGGGTMTIVQGR